MNIEEMARFCKKTGMIYPSGEIYGCLAGFWDYGPRGVEIKRSIREAFWRRFVLRREDIVGIDGAIITHPKTWYASGHVENFFDPVVICTECNTEIRADHLIQEVLGINVEGKTIEELEKIIVENKIRCPVCGKESLRSIEIFNLMFKTYIGVKKERALEAYLRPETAQNIFINFRNTFEVMRKKLPLGIAQIGRVYRNEISPRNLLLRSREFELAEIEYFIHPEMENKCPYIKDINLSEKIIIYTKEDQIAMKEPFEGTWEDLLSIIKDNWHVYWLYEIYKFLIDLGIPSKKLRLRQHLPDELSHYSKDTWDIEYAFDFGWKEIVGIANRGDYDLRQHMKYSNKDLCVYDENIKGKVVPYVIEPSIGIDRVFMAIIDSAYTKEGKRIYLKLKPFLAPIKVAVFPLVNKDGLYEKAYEVYAFLKKEIDCVFFDSSGSIGKRYARMDEIGTPYCITIDYQTLEDDTVTIRYRDTTHQDRIKIRDLVDFLKNNMVKE